MWSPSCWSAWSSSWSGSPEAPRTQLDDSALSGAGAVYAWSGNGKNTAVTKVMGIFKSMDQLLGPDFEKGLSRLKATAES